MSTLPPLVRVLATPSIWVKTAKSSVATFPQLAGSGGHFDAAIVGGGIFGIQTAYKLMKEGKKVVILEGRKIGAGTTGYSTSKFTSQQNLLYSTLAKMHGHETAKKYGAMNQQALADVEAIVKALKIDCDMDVRSHTTWTSNESKVSSIKQEYDESIRCGLPAEYITDPNLLELPKSIQAKAAVRFTHQLQLNSYAYVNELAKMMNQAGVPIYEHSRVTDVTSDTPHRVTTEQGHVTADHVVLATHMPILDRSAHFAFLPPSRSHCIAVQLKSGEDYKTAMGTRGPSTTSIHDMYISCDTPMRSLRTATSERDDILVVAGEAIEMGNQSNTQERYEALEVWAREHYKVEAVVARWSAMDYFSSDHLPYIGYLYRGTTSIYTATGFSKWGLSAGVAAASIVTDLIQKRDNPFFSIVDARRWDLLKQAPGFIQENIHTTKHFIGDKLKAMVAPDMKTLRTGEGGIVKAPNGETVGAFLDGDGKYHLVKPVCTHLGCHLIFNQGDGVWDCPCHGSQFDVDGGVIHGPACKNLLKPEMQW